MLREMGKQTRALIWGLLTGAVLGGCLVYVTKNLQPNRHFQNNNQRIDSIAFSPDGESLAVSTDSGSGYDLDIGPFRLYKRIQPTLVLWDVSTHRKRHVFDAPESSWPGLSSSPTTPMLAVAESRKISIWDINSGNFITSLPIGGRLVALSPDGKRMVCAEFEELHVWNLNSKKEERTLPLAKRRTYPECISFSPDSKLIAAALAEELVQVWNVDTGDLVTTIAAHLDSCDYVAFSPDGKRLVSTGDDEVLRVWKTSDWNCETTIPVMKRSAPAAFTPDGKYLASIKPGPKITLWNTTTWKEASTTTVPGTNYINALSISANGKYLAAGDTVGKVHLHKLDQETN